MALSRHARLLRASWLSERRTLRQGLVALGLGSAAGSRSRLTLANDFRRAPSHAPRVAGRFTTSWEREPDSDTSRPPVTLPGVGVR